MAAGFQTTRRIEFADTDMAGLVHFANFFRFMEAAEQEFLRAHGMSVAMTWAGQALGFPRVAASCDYLKPVRFEDVLQIAVHVTNIGSKSVTYQFDFTLAGDVVARGQVTTVCCQVLGDHQLKSVVIPAGLREKLTSASATTPA